MKKINKKLSQEQIARGVIFASTLSRSTTESLDDTTHEVLESDRDKNDQIRRLLDDSFFNNSPWKYNIIRR